MADKLESDLAEGIEDDAGLKAMAQKLAPRGPFNPGPPPLPPSPYAPLKQGDTVEQKLQQIERLVGEIRSMAAQVKGMLG